MKKKHWASLALALSVLAACSTLVVPEYSGPETDHYDGSQFFNLDKNYKDKSLSDVLRWQRERIKPEWPKWVEVQPAQGIPPRVSEGVRLTFVNHATVLIQVPEGNFLTDPVWSKVVGPYSWLGPKRVHGPGIRFEDLPSIDAAVVSHNHYDHMDIPTLQRLAKKGSFPIVAGLGNKRFFEQNAIESGIDLDWWDTHSLPSGVKITAVPTRHWSFRSWGNRRQTLWAGYVIETGQFKIYFPGDTGFGQHFQQIRDRLGPMDVCLLPIGAYLPRDFMKDNHTSPHDTVLAHKILGCKRTLGVHFATFQLSDEEYGQPERDLDEALKKEGIALEDFRALVPGQHWDLTL